ncbi:MAG: PhzF family phenazine biosynthesis isomerase [Chloroflexota bacterium]|nr:PhzF family phenazine biosynthesis isomerase [Chloroflexota bacterium]
MTHPLYQVDAFTKAPFGGNPAGVCLLTAPAPDDWMQALAAEMNLSETAFLLPEEEGWRLRWFTPATEIDLCGHATLASAKVLFETRPELRPGPISFWTRSGQMQARWVGGRVELDFPVFTPEPLMIELGIAGMLGFQPVEAAFSGNFFLFEAAEEETIRTAKPDFGALAASTMPEVMITAKGESSDYDFVSRFFAPQLGFDEDPVTGSAHCLLAPYWAEKLGKTTFAAYQASERGGWLTLRLEGDRLRIAGDSVIVFSAELLV